MTHEVLFLVLLNVKGEWFVEQYVTDGTEECELLAFNMREKKVNADVLYICATPVKKHKRDDNL